MSYVRCDECGYESTNIDHYLDLSLPIKNSTGDPTLATTNTSLEMAVENFLRPEHLDGNNQYNCDACAKKVNATKGLKLKSLPEVLTVQMKRFTLDWSTYKMIKVHDRVTFPFVLNGNNYLNGFEGIKDKHSERQQQVIDGTIET